MSPTIEAGEALGRYLLLEELGRGGMAVVFRGKDPTLGREVAIKVMHVHLRGKAEHALRFTREARAVAALRHPHIVEIYDFSEGSDGGPGQPAIPAYIVSELVRGPTLRQFVDRHGWPLPEVAVMVAVKLATALQAAHEQGIIHRDLKPENVMIAEGGRLVLTDFGVARIREGETVTQTGAMVGSPAYMSPEQARGGDIDARSDLFSLGTVLYQLVTGELPFKGIDALSTVLKVVEGRYAPPEKHNPAVGRSLERLIARLLQVRPEHRFSEAREVDQALREILSEVDIVDVDGELRRYFADPVAYTEGLKQQVVDRSLERARRSLASGDYPRVLSLCDRVLAMAPDDPEAMRLMAQVSDGKGGGKRWLILGAGSALLLAGSGALVWFLLGPAPQPPTETPPTRAMTVAAGPIRSPDRGADPRASVDPRATRMREPLPDRGLGPSDQSLVSDRRRTGRRLPPRLGPTSDRRRDAAPLVPRPPDRGPVSAEAPDRAVAARQGELLLRVGPFCEARVDGRPAGTSPMTRPLRIQPGPHRVECLFRGGGRFERTVTVKPGQQTVVEGTPRVKVRLDLSLGDAVRLDDQVFRASFQIEANRYRVDILRNEQSVKGGWVTIPTADCTLKDAPEIRCQ